MFYCLNNPKARRQATNTKPAPNQTIILNVIAQRAPLWIAPLLKDVPDVITAADDKILSAL
jgi:hypothetical protein